MDALRDLRIAGLFTECTSSIPLHGTDCLKKNNLPRSMGKSRAILAENSLDFSPCPLVPPLLCTKHSRSVHTVAIVHLHRRTTMATLAGKEKYQVNTQNSDWTEEQSSPGNESIGQNVGRIERIISCMTGGALVIEGLRRRSLRGGLTALSGAAMLFRGLSGRCAVYSALGIDRTGANTTDMGRRKVPSTEAIKIQRSVTVDQSPESLYRFWRNMDNLPLIMSHVQDVQTISPILSHWIVDSVPGGPSIQWDAEIISDVPNERIGWRSLKGSDVDHAGSVQFEPAEGGRMTRIIVTLQYVPPAGRLGAAVASIFGEDPGKKIEEDLARFKKEMESPAAAG